MSFRDIDEIADEVYRRSAARIDELRAANQRVAAENRALIEQSAERIRQTLQHAEAGKKEAGQDHPADRHGPWGDRVEQFGMPQPDRSRSAELRQQDEQREAIARAAAARQDRTVVTPIDDDGDDEAEYYRRKSWLV
ncbi:hypothetical protein [Nocardia sp. NBC_00416]|uniref:hypothetical protein n=1 Tax=Nocardia sp. NBC_00416 TaxID=2975991 RepID=UPI002E1FF366